MREEQEFQDWTQDQDDRLRASLGALRQDVDAAGIPDVRFVMRRAGRQRHRAVAGIAAGAAAVLGLSWFGYQALDGTPSTAPAGDGRTTERDQTEDLPDGTTESPEEETGSPSETEEPTGSGENADAAPADPEKLVLAESGGPDLSLFVPPALWASQPFTLGAASSQGAIGDFETTALFECDPDDVYWGAEDEGTFGLLSVGANGSAFGTQRVRVLESAQTAATYVNDLDAALAACEAPAEADNIELDVEPLELSGAYRVTTTFRDGTDPMTDFYYVVQHDGTTEAVSTFRLIDWSADDSGVTDAQAVAELERLSALVADN
ncbi:hypothetical protein [Ornithinimicrobium cavernae]|uniref:hypothetical protein n=1 Tax=Ornithinimicrobium cavernae TaxID=2666047 RepID=UPI000D69BD06|nr:hypothetical protein [Ornithinimicrobium cavernae]